MEEFSLLTVVRDMVWQAEPVKLIAMADLTKLRDTELQLVHASKLASLGEMASAIGHELNQPLSVIRLAAENALRGLDRSIGRDVTASKLVRIVGQVERAQRITDQIRRYGRLPSSQNQHFPCVPHWTSPSASWPTSIAWPGSPCWAASTFLRASRSAATRRCSSRSS